MTVKPLIIAGPSGIGKSTLVKQLEPFGFFNVMGTYTRDPRPGEISGVDAEFMSESQYIDEENSGGFFMSNRYLNGSYGIRRARVNRIVDEGHVPVFQIYLPVINQYLDEYPDSKTLYLLPKNLEFLANRLKKRPQTDEEFSYRIDKGIEELNLFESTYQDRFMHHLIIDSDDNTKYIEAVRSFYERQQNKEGQWRYNTERL